MNGLNNQKAEIDWILKDMIYLYVVCKRHTLDSKTQIDWSKKIANNMKQRRTTKKAGMIILRSNKTYFKTTKVPRDTDIFYNDIFL